MNSVVYTPEQYEKDRKKLLRWLRAQPWGCSDAEDLAQDAILRQLERISSGKAPKSLYFLAKDAARDQRLLPRRGKKGEWLPCRSSEVAAPAVELESRRICGPEADLSNRIPFKYHHWASPKLKTAMCLILYGHTMSVAAAKVDLAPHQLSMLIADFGRKISGKRRKIMFAAPTKNNAQLALFGGVA